MKTQPLKGMRDLLPAEQTLRDYIQGQILEVYRAAGFERISTPMLEDLENLDKSDGGENLNLIFKVLKRGDKLTAALNAGKYDSLADMGLRYDLTLPLSRYYAANRNALPNPFKVIQTDRVFRAERPQKGRLREFVQCDIDILGDESPNAEVELIDVTAILRGMLESMGFAPDTLDSVCITFDKMDKVGAEGVRAELTEKGLPADAIQQLADFLAQGSVTLDAVAARCADPSIADDLKYVLATAGRLAEGKYQVAYCPSLVRGQGYYTGMVFEVVCPLWPAAAATTTWWASSWASRCRRWASPSALSGSAASCWKRATRSPAPSRRSPCSTLRGPTSPLCWPRPRPCGPTTASPSCPRAKSWANSWPLWKPPVSPGPPLRARTNSSGLPTGNKDILSSGAFGPRPFCACMPLSPQNSPNLFAGSGCF